ncbi:hypothetical protein [Parvibaculum sp.]|uniref:hypothetical protein n=1 Tax=Parvibaculum sp. TaxID=2024848 RepID=UPI002732401D|nr:hypothetical protein [Parvibaculum sp.]MDP3328740.1 hypothetical protein [Parvibaculum sp.]
MKICHIIIERHTLVKGAKVPNTLIGAIPENEVDAEIKAFIKNACCETVPFKRARVFDTAAFEADHNTEPFLIVTPETIKQVAKIRAEVEAGKALAKKGFETNHGEGSWDRLTEYRKANNAKALDSICVALAADAAKAATQLVLEGIE